MYLLVWICTHISTDAHALEHVCICQGQRLLLSVFLLLCFTLKFWDSVTWWCWMSLLWLDWLISDWMPLVSLSALAPVWAYNHALLCVDFYLACGANAWVLRLAWGTFLHSQCPPFNTRILSVISSLNVRRHLFNLSERDCSFPFVTTLSVFRCFQIISSSQ